MSWRAARASMGMSLVFMIVYGALNLITSFRKDVGSFYFPFERHIPFVAIMIIPYLSIDLFYVLSPFVCKTEQECTVLVKRLMLALLIGAACFAIYPLKFGFQRPQVGGFLGWAFDLFRQLDQPFNQLPSLHIANVMIIAPLYAARGGRMWKSTVWVWTGLIVVSTLLTYQHHIVDLVGGFALTALCFYVFPDPKVECSPSLPNYRVATYYFVAAMALVIPAAVFHPAGLLLFWPVTALLIAAGGYAFNGALIFRKHNGKLPLPTLLMLWPVLLGQHVSFRCYRRNCSPWDELTDRVWIGRKLSNDEAREAVAAGVSAVIDLTGEFSEAAPFLEVDYLQLPIMDLSAPTADQLDRAIDFINAAPGVVYIHCKIGYSRTAAVAGAYLLARGQAKTPEQAIAMLRRARPSIIIRPEAMKAIHNYASTEEMCGVGSEVPMASAAV